MNGSDIKAVLASYKYSAGFADTLKRMAASEIKHGKIEIGLEDLLYSMFNAGRASMAADIAAYHAPQSREAIEAKETTQAIKDSIPEAARLAMEAAHV